ncbi:MAG: ATP-binding protein [Acidobacteriota bacterium]|nr:ATP-binding protein [Acidobacteriota bacterium]
MSIRLRLTLWYAAVLLAALSLFAGGMWFAIRQRLTAGVDQRLAAKVQGMRTLLDLESGMSAAQLQDELSEFAKEMADGTLLLVRDGAGRPIVTSPGRAAAFLADLNPAPTYRDTVDKGRPFRVLSTTIESGGAVYQTTFATPLDEVQDVLASLRNLLFLAVPAVLLAAGLGGYWISRRAMAPVDEMTRTAQSLGGQDLSARLSVPNTGDELQRLAEAWNGVLARMETALQRVRQFTADASHELRTPVALIRATAELTLRRKRETEEYRLALEQIQAEAERMTELTGDLLALARADASDLALSFTGVDLSGIARDIVDRMQPVAASKGIHLTAGVPREPVIVRGDEPAIRRLVMILVDNALKHTPQDGEVTVTAAGNGISVRDNGEGIDAEALPHIFERFYRADPARSGSSGSGLGLSIAQTIAQLHGTAIQVESTPGAGARFSLSFPDKRMTLTDSLTSL